MTGSAFFVVAVLVVAAVVLVEPVFFELEPHPAITRAATMVTINARFMVPFLSSLPDFRLEYKTCRRVSGNQCAGWKPQRWARRGDL